jgi:hypothetical protein
VIEQGSVSTERPRKSSWLVPVLGIAAVVASVSWLVIYPMVVQRRTDARHAVLQAKREYRSAIALLRFKNEADSVTIRHGGTPTKNTAVDKNVHSTESRFMSECRACASAESCERDRLSVVSGRDSDNYSPCD